MSSQKVSSGKWTTCMHQMVQTTERVTKWCQDCRMLFLSLAAYWTYMGRFKKYRCLAPTHRECALIALGCGLGIRSLQSSPGDCKVHPRMTASVWKPGITSSWRMWLPGQGPIPTLEELSNCFAISLLLPLTICST